MSRLRSNLCSWRAMMDRRDFFKGAIALAGLPGAAHAAAPKYRVCVLGIGPAVGAADCLRWTEPLWMDRGRFELSTFLVWKKDWSSSDKLYGSFGEVPWPLVRGWADLAWVADDLRGTDFLLVLCDLWCEAREGIAARIVREGRRHAPKSLTLALESWHVVDGRLVAERGRRFQSAVSGLYGASETLQLVRGDGAPEARIWLESASLREKTDNRDKLEDCYRRVQWSYTDRLAAPVIRMLASPSRANFLPSSCSRG